MFLLRKLHADGVVIALAKETPSNLLLKTLVETVSRKPRSPRTSVMPYVILIALARKGDWQALAKASKLNAPYHRWYSYLAAQLIQDFQPTSFNTVSIPAAKLLVRKSSRRGRTTIQPETVQ